MPDVSRPVALAARSMFAGVACGVGVLIAGGCESAPSTTSDDTASGETASRPTPTTSLGDTVRGDLRIDHDEWRELGFRWDWATEGINNGRSRVVEFEPSPDAIALRDDQNVVRVFDTNNGRRRWGLEVDNPIRDFVSIDRIGDRYLVSSLAGVYLLTAEGGNLVARGSFGQSVSTPPALAGTNAIYGCPTGELMSFNYVVGGGQKAWGNANQTQAIEGRPVIVGGAVGAVSQGGDVIFLDARTGQLISRVRIFGGVAGDPATDGTAMFIASLDQSVWAFTPDGRLRWRHRTDRPVRGQPVVHGGVLYVELGDQSQIALDATSGDVVWQTPNLPGEVIAVVGEELVLWHAPSRRLSMIDLPTGDTIAASTLSSAEHVFTDRFVDGNLYVATRGGVLAKFVAR